MPLLNPLESKSFSTKPSGDKRLYAIGDIHGRADLLDQLIARLENEFQLEGDHQVIFLGDYVDRGNDSAGVLDRLIAFGEKYPETIFLKGNHEQAMLDFLAVPEETESWIDWGGQQALESYGIENVLTSSPSDLRDALADLLPDEHFNFLLNLALLYQDGDYVFVHAGLKPGRPIEQQRERDLLWIRGEFYNADGEEWTGKCIVHGHTPQNKPENISWRINVDTGAFSSGNLTAVILDGTIRRFIST